MNQDQAAARVLARTHPRIDPSTRAVVYSVVVMVAALVAVFSPVGCASSPTSTGSYLAAKTSYVGAVTIMGDAVDAGWVDLDTAERFEANRTQARALLNIWGDLVTEGSEGEFSEDRLAKLKRLLDEMIQAQEAIDDERNRDSGSHSDGRRDRGLRDAGGGTVEARAPTLTGRARQDRGGAEQDRRRLAREAPALARRAA